MIDKRKELITRYLSGRMDPRDREIFQQQLGADPRLRTMLEAEELIEGTIRRDLDVIPVAHEQTRAAVMGRLADFSPANLPRMGGAQAAGKALPAGGAAAVKGIVASLIGAGLLAGGYLFLAPKGGQVEERPAPAAVESAPEIVPMPAPSAPEGKESQSPLVPETATPAVETPAGESQAVPRDQARQPQASTSRSTSETKPARSTPPASSPAPTVETPKENPAQPSQPAVQKKPRPVIVKKDSVVRLKIDVNKPRQ